MHGFFTITGIIFAVAIFGFAVSSFLEHEKRAGLITLGLVAVFALGWFGIGRVLPGATFFFSIVAWALLVICAVVLALPVGQPEPLKIDREKTERFDERHIMFGRAELHEDMPQYEEYYTHLNPGMKKTDDEMRRLPELGASH